MEYGGYLISTSWSDENCGFKYHIYDEKGVIVKEAEDETFWYEENALIEAKKIIDSMKEKSE